MPVLPDPMTTKPSGLPVSRVSPVGVTQRTPSSMANGGAKDSGTSEALRVASTTARRATTSVVAPVRTERHPPVAEPLRHREVAHPAGAR